MFCSSSIYRCERSQHLAVELQIHFQQLFNDIRQPMDERVEAEHDSLVRGVGSIDMILMIEFEQNLRFLWAKASYSSRLLI